MLQRFRVLHPDNPLNKTIWQHRLQKQYLKEEQERVFKKRKVRSTRLFGLPCTQGCISLSMMLTISVVLIAAGEEGKRAPPSAGEGGI